MKKRDTDKLKKNRSERRAPVIGLKVAKVSDFSHLGFSYCLIY